MTETFQTIPFSPIGTFHTAETQVPRHWSVSESIGTIILHKALLPGLKDIQPGDRIVVLFHFHQSEPFQPGHMIQHPPSSKLPTGVFSTCSPIRPNPLGLSVLKVQFVAGNRIQVEGIDMIDGTPILDIKPYVPVSEPQ